MKCATNIIFDEDNLSIDKQNMIVLPNFAANLVQTDDAVTKYADPVQSEALLGLPLSGKQKVST